MSILLRASQAPGCQGVGQSQGFSLLSSYVFVVNKSSYNSHTCKCLYTLPSYKKEPVTIKTLGVDNEAGVIVVLIYVGLETTKLTYIITKQPPSFQ